MKFIPCDEKQLIRANHSTGLMKSSKYGYTRGKGITKSGKIRTKEEENKLKNK
jgi:hypothetical protein